MFARLVNQLAILIYIFSPKVGLAIVAYLNNQKVVASATSKAYGGGFLGFQETPFDSKAISNITCLNKYTIINILAGYGYLSANTK